MGAQRGGPIVRLAPRRRGSALHPVAVLLGVIGVHPATYTLVVHDARGKSRRGSRARGRPRSCRRPVAGVEWREPAPSRALRCVSPSYPGLRLCAPLASGRARSNCSKSLVAFLGGPQPGCTPCAFVVGAIVLSGVAMAPHSSSNLSSAGANALTISVAGGDGTGLRSCRDQRRLRSRNPSDAEALRLGTGGTQDFLSAGVSPRRRRPLTSPTAPALGRLRRTRRRWRLSVVTFRRLGAASTTLQPGERLSFSSINPSALLPRRPGPAPPRGLAVRLRHRPSRSSTRHMTRHPGRRASRRVMELVGVEVIEGRCSPRRPGRPRVRPGSSTAR